MLLFSYGSNVNDAHLRSWIPHRFVRIGRLDGYELVFDHFGYANIKPGSGAVLGTISEIADIDITTLRWKEPMYKLVDVIIGGTDCKTFISSVRPGAWSMSERYRSILTAGYRAHMLPLPDLPPNRLKLLINVSGTLFGAFLTRMAHPVLRAIGLLLLLVDGSMVMDELAGTSVYELIEQEHKQSYYILFRLIPTFIMAPLILYYSEDPVLTAAAIVFLLVDLFTLKASIKMDE